MKFTLSLSFFIMKQICLIIKKDKGRSHRACTGAFTLCPLFICLPKSKGGKIVASKAGQNGQDRAKHSRSRRQNWHIHVLKVKCRSQLNIMAIYRPTWRLQKKPNLQPRKKSRRLHANKGIIQSMTNDVLAHASFWTFPIIINKLCRSVCHHQVTTPLITP